MHRILFVALIAACGGPSAKPSTPGGGSSAAPVEKPAATTHAMIGPFRGDVPAAWKSQPITSQMRAAHYKLGAASELIVYYFGPEGAGPVEANLERWRGQFTSPDGQPVKDRVEKVKVGSLEATMMWVAGNYANNVTGESKADTHLIGVVLEGGSAGPLYFRLLGPKAEIEASEKDFRAFLGSLREGH